jgi:hypothetical protein
MSLDGLGMLTIMQDPIWHNQIVATHSMDIRHLMGVFDITWTNLDLGFPLTLRFYDDLDTSRIQDPQIIRTTALFLQASYSHGIGGEGLRFSVIPALSLVLLAYEDPSKISAYGWAYEAPYYQGMLGLGLSTLRRFAWEIFGRGASLAAYGRYTYGASLERNPLPRVEGILQAARETFPALRLSLYGAWDQWGMTPGGTSIYYSSTAFSSVASVEYVSRQTNTNLQWLAGGELEAKLFSVEIQGHLSHLYFNRIFGSLAYRGALFDDLGNAAAQGTVLDGSLRLAQSLVLRLGLTVSSALVARAPVQATLGFTGIWKISNLTNGISFADDFWLGPTFSLLL